MDTLFHIWHLGELADAILLWLAADAIESMCNLVWRD